jgi:hypothetical protein
MNEPGWGFYKDDPLAQPYFYCADPGSFSRHCPRYDTVAGRNETGY